MALRFVVLCLLPAAYCLLASACQPARVIGREPTGGQGLRIGIQAGVGYTPLHVMQARRLLERRVPGLGVEWKSIATPEGVEEALASGTLDVAHGPPTAFLLARERGVPARVLAGVAELPVAVVGGRSEARSIRELGPDDRVAVPSFGGWEHTLLRMAALRELGDWQALDRLVVVRPHAEARAALLGRGEITAHVAPPPYLNAELEAPGTRRLVDLAEALGPGSAVVAYTTPALRERRSALVEVYLDALREAAELVRRDPAEAARLVPHDELQLPPDAMARYLAQSPGLHFSTRVRGLPRLAEFLELSGQLRRAPAWHELVFDDVQGP